MILRILFGQLIDTYPGQNAPEALEVADEYAEEISPEFLEGKIEEYKKQGIYSRLEVIDVEIDGKLLEKILKPKNELKGEIKKEE